MKTYTKKSNATRAGKKQYGEGNFTVITVTDGTFGILPTEKVAPAKPTETVKAIAPTAFGYRDGTKFAAFGAMVAQEGGTTMQAVIEAEWNPSRRSYYSPEAKELEAQGLIKINRKMRPAVLTVTKKGLAKGMGLAK